MTTLTRTISTSTPAPVSHAADIGAPRADSGADDAFRRGVAAGKLREWHLARTLFAMSIGNCGSHPATLHNLAVSCWQLAQHDAAQHYFSQAAAAAPLEAVHRRQQRALEAWRATCRQRLGSERLEAVRGASIPLCLTLLGPHHAAPLAGLQHAGSRRLVRLPVLADAQAGRRWIATQLNRPVLLPLAFVDPQRGLVGMAALEQHGDSALYWICIGDEFQGRGLGHAALCLLRVLALRRGVRHLFSSIFDTNTRSIRLMRRAGFQRMPGVVEAGPVPLPFHCYTFPGARTDDDESRLARLQLLLAAADRAPATVTTGSGNR